MKEKLNNSRGVRVEQLVRGGYSEVDANEIYTKEAQAYAQKGRDKREARLKMLPPEKRKEVEDATTTKRSLARKKSWKKRKASCLDMSIVVDKQMKNTLARLQKKGVDFYFVDAECLHCHNCTTGIIDPTAAKTDKTCQNCPVEEKKKTKKTLFPRGFRKQGQSGPKSEHWECVGVYEKGGPKYNSKVEELNKID